MLDKYTEQNPKILHDGEGDDGGIAKCGVDYFAREGHGWIESNDKDIIDMCGARENRKLCRDCFVGEYIKEFNK